MVHPNDIFGAPHEHIYPRTLYVPKRSKRSSPTRPSLDLSRTTIDKSLDVEDPHSRPATASGCRSTSPNITEHIVQRRPSRRKRVFTKVIGGLRRTASVRSVLTASASSNRPKSPSISNARSNPTTESEPEHFTSRGTTPELLSPQLIPLAAQQLRIHNNCPLEPDHKANEKPLVYSIPHLPVLNVRLNMIPEAEGIALSTEKRMWVAVEIEGQINLPLEDSSELKEHAGLDVVIVIDNSRFASQSCIENACKLILHLARLLDAPHDRIAVFCTSCRHPVQDQNALTGCQLHPLKAPCFKTLQKELRPIRQNQARPLRPSARLCDTLTAAIRVLTEPDSSPDQTLRFDRGHIFILSPSAVECLEEVQGIAPSQVHVVCPALIPASANNGFGGGWHLTSGFSTSTHGASGPCDMVDFMMDKIQTIIAHARTRSSPGAVTDINVRINPAVGAIVETVLGSTNYSHLRPGQVLSMFVEVSVEAVPQAYTSGLFTPSFRDSGVDLADAFSELEIMLGESSTDLFTVEIWYKHSLFPTNTELVVSETCRVRRHNPSSEWSGRCTPNDFGQTNDTDRLISEVQKRLARFVCSQYDPETSLAKLEDMFFNEDCNLQCPDYLELLREELFYQLQDTQDHNSVNAESLDNFLSHSSPDLGRFSWETRNSQILNIPEDSVPEDHVHRRSSSTSPMTVIHKRRTDTIPEESPDQARKIWRHIRRSSKGYKQPLSQRSEISLNCIADENLRTIKQRAVQNKRSVGADTLRSLTIGTGAGVLDENYAPWL